MNIRYYIDPETGLPHIYKHNVAEAEVEEVLARPGEDRPGTEGARVAIGQTSAGRYLRVIYVLEPEPDSIFVITAFELRGKPSLPTGADGAAEAHEREQVSARVGR